MRISLPDFATKGPTSSEWKLYYRMFPEELEQDVLELIIFTADEMGLDINVTGISHKLGGPIKAIINGKEVVLSKDANRFVDDIRNAALHSPHQIEDDTAAEGEETSGTAEDHSNCKLLTGEERLFDTIEADDETL